MEIRCHFEFWRESFHVEVLARCIKKKKGVEKFLRIHARCCNINTMSKVRLIVGAIKKKKKVWKRRIFYSNSTNFSMAMQRSW